MKIDPGMSYLLTEFEGGFVITHGAEKVGNPGSQPLVLADRQHLPEYLATYLSLREAGKPKRECHEAAIKACQFQKVIKV